MPRGDFDTVVHSVFRSSLNLHLDKPPRLLTLLASKEADLPQGIRLATPPGFSFEAELAPGQRLACRGGILGNGGGCLEIDLRGAERWKCRLPRLDAIPPPVAAAWTSVWSALDERQEHTGADIRVAHLLRADIPEQSAVDRRMGALVRELVEAARRLDPPPTATIAGLIGLGSGLTPGGDDFLAGFLTGLRCTAGSNAKRLLFLSGLGKAVVRLSRRTNDISRTYLIHAAHGQVSSRLATLADAIAGGDNSDRLLAAAEDAMRAGHSSGMETVTGLLVGLSAWGNGLLPI